MVWTHVFTRHTDAAGDNNESGMEGIRCRILHVILDPKSYGNCMVELCPEDVARICPCLAEIYALGEDWAGDDYLDRHNLTTESILIEANERDGNNTEIRPINN